jgi:hypothetical protein
MQGTTPIPGYKYNAGIAYVAIPRDLDRAQYLKDCYINHHISIRTHDGGFHNRVPISPEVLNFIIFPDTTEKLGSPVIYVTDHQYQNHYIVNRLVSRDELGDSSEHKFKFTRKIDDAYVEVSGSAQDRSINIVVNGSDKKGAININMFNDNKDCELALDIQGDFVVKATNNTSFDQYGEFKISTHDEDSNTSSFTQTSQENKFNSAKFIINNGEDKMVLGNKLVSFFEDLIDEISKITTLTKLGKQPILNKAKVLALKRKLKDFISQEAFLNK